MKLEGVKEIANAVLYEGYLLYPYRQSAIKNRTRWTFGAVYPRAYSEASGGIEPWTMHTECLVTGQANDVVLDITVRFLHLLVRSDTRYETPANKGVDTHASEWGLASRFAHEPLQEGVEREVSASDVSLKDLLASPRRIAIKFPSKRSVDSTPMGTETIREQQALSGAFIMSAESVDTNLFRLSVEIENTTPGTSTATSRREAILLQSFVSTHTILHVCQGDFISLLEPPEAVQAYVKACQNVRTWPVLVGNQGERDVLLSSPIILYDYPQIAPESPGPLFDGGEIDEILSLRILTLSDDEKEQMRQDEHTREILERTESLTPDQFMKMHGVFRDVRPVTEGGKA